MAGRRRSQSAGITRLRYFVAACEFGGFSKAASRMGVAQPAVTRQVRLLERDLGVALFTRNGRDAAPTEAGIWLLNRARPHIEGLDAVIGTMRREFGRPRGDIRFGICPSIAPLFLDRDGGIPDSPEPRRLRVIEAYSGELKSLMATGNLDLALTYSQAVDDPREATDLLTERLALVAREAPPGTTLKVDDLAGLSLILPSRRHQLRRIIDAVARMRGIALVPAVELDSIPAVMTMLDDRDRGYATILPFHSVTGAAADGRVTLRAIDDPAMVRTIALVRPGSGGCPVPDRLVESIAARARTIKTTMQAVR